MLLPGCWIAFASDRLDAGYGVRVALALVFAPFVVAVEWWTLRYAGISVDAAVNTVLLINLPAAILVARSLRSRQPTWQWRQFLIGSAVFAAVAFCTALPWIYDPAFRSFSWHGLLHTDIIYSLARGGLPPEDPELAGVQLAYPWLGHVYWLVLARAADLSPTVVYLISNLVLLAATGILAYALAKRLGASDIVALSLPVALALGPDLLGLIGWSIIPPNDSGVWWAFLGDLRYVPFLLKFVTFEVMTFGLSLFAALLLLQVISFEKSNGGVERALAFLTVPALSALYPNLFPAAVLTLGAAGATLLLARRWLRAAPSVRDLVVWAIGAGIATVAGYLFVSLYTADLGRSVVALTPVLGIAKKTVTNLLVLGPPFLLAWFAWRKTDQSTVRAALFFLGSAALASVALNLAMRLGGLNEYKFMFTASMAILPAALLGLQHTWLQNFGRQRGALVGLVGFLVLVMGVYAVRRVPRFSTQPFAVRESSFWLAAAPGTSESGWTDAVRAETPENTLLVSRRPTFHASAFTGRTLFVSMDPEVRHFGYNLVISKNLVKLRGYSSELYHGRVQLLDRLYSDAQDAERAQLLGQLTESGRPLAFAFVPGDDRSLLDYLRRQQFGRDLYDAGGRAVYFIPATNLARAKELSASGVKASR
jgi:hypothetical protein